MRYRCVNLIYIFTIFWFSNLSGMVAFTTQETSRLPSRHIISGVTLHKQLNGLCCGPASIETVFDYWGEDIDQKAIADVARTTSIGTYTQDIVRTGHFSNLSLANGNFFPHEAHVAGFSNRPLGYASFSHSSKTPWWNELKRLICSNIPVILLMKYAPEDPTGHYRVIVGYDEDEKLVYFIDPWDRDLKNEMNPDEMVNWTKIDFESAWNYYDAYGTENPYWGAIIIPWSVNLTTIGKIAVGSSIKVTAVITYPCPMPFEPTDYIAYNTKATISLSEGLVLLDGMPQVEVGILSAGKSFTTSWRVKINKYVPYLSITVMAGGLVSSSVPEEDLKGYGVSPYYEYTDWIGGKESISLICLPNT